MSIKGNRKVRREMKKNSHSLKKKVMKVKKKGLSQYDPHQRDPQNRVENQASSTNAKLMSLHHLTSKALATQGITPKEMWIARKLDFARLLFNQTHSATTAAMLAGFSELTARKHIARLKQDPIVVSEILRLEELNGKTPILHREEALQILTRIGRDEDEPTQYRISAIDRIARMCAWDEAPKAPVEEKASSATQQMQLVMVVGSRDQLSLAPPEPPVLKELLAEVNEKVELPRAQLESPKMIADRAFREDLIQRTVVRKNVQLSRGP